MNEGKRKRARAIIFVDGKIVSMYREKNGRIFYTFPGGGMEEGESEEDCVVREVHEEFGLTVRPVKKVYVYENEISLEHFYVCEWVAGQFGSGQGEEFQPDRNNGVYKQVMIEIAKIPSLPLMPPEIAEVFFQDYIKNGKNLTNFVKIVKGEMH